MPGKRRIRVALVAVIVLSSVAIGTAWATRPPRDTAPERAQGTVITAQGGAIGNTGRMVAFGPEGEIIAEHSKYKKYFDVDPVGNSSRTVEYVAVEGYPPGACPDWIDDAQRCTRQMVLRTDLRTNETTVVWETYYPKLHKMHDFDRINETHLVVADIYRDEVQFVNVSSGEVTWRWNANQSYEYGEEGGQGSEGFTHINDVETVREGWVMATLRNLDRTVFIDPGNGVVRNWTIGCEDCHDILYEHHNSDYMPGDATTPPTVIVADSENDRIVEFRRLDGEWRIAWSYTNARMHWPRDADRLPNGHTLITGSNSNRVYEIDTDGDIVWRTTIGNPYEAERLGTADESANRPHRPERVVAVGGPVDRLSFLLREAVPSELLSSALFVMPYWVGLWELLPAVMGSVAAVTLLGVEVKWYAERRSPSDSSTPHG